MKTKLRVWAFLLALVIFFALFDLVLAHWGENYCPLATNDFEITRLEHPEKVWDKVFFGNSAVIAGYREELSTSGHVNLGMDYAVVSDLWKMLRGGHINVGSEIVVGLNIFTLLDEFDTNPAYIWHRGAIEPYAYFHRDKLMNYAESTAKALLRGSEIEYANWHKILYYGSLSETELAEKMVTYNENYFCRDISGFRRNLADLGRIADYCAENGLRLRIVWMPYNPDVDEPELMDSLRSEVGAICTEYGLDLLDMSAALEAECFHDVGHLNYEYGAYKFTAEVDEWLQN